MPQKNTIFRLTSTFACYYEQLNGKTVDIVHISATGFKAEPLSHGTLIRVDLQELQPFLDNDEAYFIWRMPHKSLDEIFAPRKDMNNAMERLKDFITTPIVAEKFGRALFPPGA